MTKIWLAVGLAVGMAAAVRAQDEAPAAAGTVKEAVEQPAAPAQVRHAEQPAAVEMELTGKIVSETRKNQAGEETTVYLLETADAKMPILTRRNALPEGVDLATFAGKNVKMKAAVAERTRGTRTTKQIVKVISIEAAE